MSDPSIRYVSFQIGELLYALPTCVTREITRAMEVTDLAGAAPHVCGLINLRGRIITQIDPATLLGRPPQGQNSESRLLIMRSSSELTTAAGIVGEGSGPEPVALLVGAIHETFEITRSDLLSSPEHDDALRPHLVRGIHRSGDSLTMVLNAEILLAPAVDEAA